jgi:hypothetical protein
MSTQFMVLVDGRQLDTLTAEQAAQALSPELAKMGYITKKPDDVTTGPIKEPPVVVALFGNPRTQVGTFADKGRQLPVCLGTGIDYLLLIVSQDSEPDAFMPCGFDLPYDIIPGTIRATGQETKGYGLNPPASFVRPDGYQLCYFEDGAKFYRRSNLPDQEPPKRDAATNDDDVTPEITGHYEPSGSKKQ